MSVSQGIVVFPSIAAAIRAGYEIYDRISGSTDLVCRTRIENAWAMAIVKTENIK